MSEACGGNKLLSEGLHQPPGQRGCAFDAHLLPEDCPHGKLKAIPAPGHTQPWLCLNAGG
jgi:hypothetical protein